VTDGDTTTTRGSGSRPRRGGLGRGLDSLIPTAPAVTAPATAADATPYREVPVERIRPNPYQPRTAIDRQQLDELAESIRQHGLLQPLTVIPDADRDGWLLVAGERRWRAARLAGLDRVPVLVRDAAPQAMLELAIVENVVRADLSPLEEAAAFRQLIDEFGLTQQDVASRVGRSRTSIANTLRLLGAPDRLREALAAGLVSEGHARALLGLELSVDQLAALDLVLDKGLNVRQTEALVRDWASTRPEHPKDDTPRDPDERRIEDRLRSALGTRVALRKGTRGGGGSLTIQFYSDEQLQGIYDRLVGEDVW